MIEKLAKIAHSQWSGWMEYLFSKCELNDRGEMIIPKWAVDRWQRQIKTDYNDLPEEEKQSDREEAKKFLNVLQN